MYKTSLLSLIAVVLLFSLVACAPAQAAPAASPSLEPTQPPAPASAAPAPSPSLSPSLRWPEPKPDPTFAPGESVPPGYNTSTMRIDGVANWMEEIDGRKAVEPPETAALLQKYFASEKAQKLFWRYDFLAFDDGTLTGYIYLREGAAGPLAEEIIRSFAMEYGMPCFDSSTHGLPPYKYYFTCSHSEALLQQVGRYWGDVSVGRYFADAFDPYSRNEEARKSLEDERKEAAKLWEKYV